VTQLDVVAVNNASTNGTDWPFAELIGNDKSTAPTKIIAMKLSIKI
jgi:hypothetical protein